MIGLHYKRCICKVLFEVLRHAPFQCKELQLGAMIVLLQWGQRAASKGNGMVLSIVLFLGEHCSQAFLRGIRLPTGKARRNQGTPVQVQTGPFPSGCPWPPMLWGADAPDPSSLLSIVRHTRDAKLVNPLINLL